MSIIVLVVVLVVVLCCLSCCLSLFLLLLICSLFVHYPECHSVPLRSLPVTPESPELPSIWSSARRFPTEYSPAIRIPLLYLWYRACFLLSGLPRASAGSPKKHCFLGCIVSEWEERRHWALSTRQRVLCASIAEREPALHYIYTHEVGKN